MILYTPFWYTLEDRGITTYTLINKYKISSSTIARLRHNKPISTVTINDLCRILNCRVQDIISYEENSNDQIL